MYIPIYIVCSTVYTKVGCIISKSHWSLQVTSNTSRASRALQNWFVSPTSVSGSVSKDQMAGSIHGDRCICTKGSTRTVGGEPYL
jgi:hypothetical protein